MASSAKETRERFRRARVPATIALWVVSIGMLWAFFRTTERTGIGLILGGTLLLTVAIGASILQIALGIRSGLKKARTARALGVRAKDIDYFDGHWFFPKPQLPQFDPEFHEAAFDRSEPVEIVDHYDENWDSDDDRPNPNFFPSDLEGRGDRQEEAPRPFLYWGPLHAPGEILRPLAYPVHLQGDLGFP